LARRLLKKLRTIKSVLNASEDELREVPGIGPDKAKKIRELSEAEYK
jgi:ERCC4-type nuclease